MLPSAGFVIHYQHVSDGEMGMEYGAYNTSS